MIALCPLDSGVDIEIAATSKELPLLKVSTPPHGAAYVPHVCAELAKRLEPLVLVLHGTTAIHAPAIALSRRSLRSPAVHYVLVDPAMPVIGGDYGDWPDAPVTVILSEKPPEYAKEAALQARLRGWRITHESLAQVLESLSD
ncbi:unannotated protein [freshwater metagenome]|uniref:Unannotated protein n=1 Tax=freshwater metagenome TaxID=449393 RepID=A0A6J5YL42_9ZZZZ